MKTLIVCFYALCLAAATALAQPDSITSLPIGTRSNINAQLGREVKTVSVWIGITNTTTQVSTNAFQTISYNQSMGSVEGVITNAMRQLVSLVIKSNDVGQTAWSYVYIANKSIVLNLLEQVPFTVTFNASGQPVIPYEKLLYPGTNMCSERSWALGAYVPISGAMAGVERVDYVRSNLATTITTNGFDDDCWAAGLTDGILYLYTHRIDPVGQSESCGSFNPYVKIVLWYSVNRGQYESFDALTGIKIDSTIVRLSMKRTNGAPRVVISGFPGKSVTLESSPDRTNWTAIGSPITLNSTGQGEFAPPLGQPRWFVRGRIQVP